MTIREGLGYTLKNYDPCFDYNADLFCCSENGRQFRQNLALREGLPSMDANTPTDHHTLRNYNPLDDAAPLHLRQSGMILPSSYTLTSMGVSMVPCGRMPCTIRYNQVPCAKNPQSCHWNKPCGQ